MLPPIPPDYSLLTALVIGVIVAISAAYKFISDLRKPSAPASPAVDVRLLGAALGDSLAVERGTTQIVHAIDRNTEAIRDLKDEVREQRHSRRSSGVSTN